MCSSSISHSKLSLQESHVVLRTTAVYVHEFPHPMYSQGKSMTFKRFQLMQLYNTIHPLSIFLTNDKPSP